MTKIYQLESTIWEVTLRINYKIEPKRVTSSSEKPYDQLRDKEFSNINSWPIFINSLVAPTYHEYTHLIKDDNEYHHFDGTIMNFPIGGMIGDLQMEIDSNENLAHQTIDEEFVTNFCAATCVASRSAIIKTF